MGSLIVSGGKSLAGKITPQGAKNEALQVICTCLLTPEPVTIHNIPNIRDVNKLIDLIKHMGVNVTPQGEGSFRFEAQSVDLDFLKSVEFQEKGIFTQRIYYDPWATSRPVWQRKHPKARW